LGDTIFSREERMKRQLSVAVAGLIGAALMLGSTLAAQGRGGGAAAPGPAFDPKDISGFWGLSIDGRRVPPANLLPSITKASLDAYAKKDAHNVRWCNLVGTPALMDMGRPLDIRQGISQIVMTPEVTQVGPRYIYLSRSTHISPDVFDPSTNGDSIARWDGNSLLVDTVGFHETHGIMAIPGGGYRTPNARLNERYTLLDNGNTLSVVFTWTDSKMFRTPHTYEFRYFRYPANYEAVLPSGCATYDEGRIKFLEGPIAAPATWPAAGGR